MGMKTAISVPDDLFKRADHLAKTQKQTRSRLYSEAIREYLARHEPVRVARGWENSAEDFDTPERRAWLRQGLENLRAVEW
ncbi:MAG: hypothetical protein ACREDF_02500 [Thermoplasmata archaeon]